VVSAYVYCCSYTRLTRRLLHVYDVYTILGVVDVVSVAVLGDNTFVAAESRTFGIRRPVGEAADARDMYTCVPHADCSSCPHLVRHSSINHLS
jgi:hypothetical protein